MHKITRNRVALIRGLQAASKHRLLCPRAKDYLSQAVNRIRKNEGGYYLSYSQQIPGKISYAPKPQFRFDVGKRTRSTLGRFLRKRLQIKKKMITDKELEYIAGITFSTKSVQKLMFRKVQGKAIRLAYQREVGVHTCMTDHNSGLVEIYAQNVERCQLLIFGKDQGRALLWKTDKGQNVMDRVYSSSDSVITTFYEWAKRNSYIYRCHNSYPKGDVPMSDKRMHAVTLNCEDLMGFPYMDTFTYGRFLNKNRTRVRLTNSFKRAEIAMLRAQGGYETRCPKCKQRWVKQQTREGPMCTHCYKELYYTCNYCEGLKRRDGNEYIYRNRHIACPDCARRHFTECSHCIRLAPRDRMHTLRDTQQKVCDPCLKAGLQEGCFYRCTNCGKHYATRDSLYGYNNHKDNRLRCERCLPHCHYCHRKRLSDHSINACRVCEIHLHRTKQYDPNQYAHHRPRKVKRPKTKKNPFNLESYRSSARAAEMQIPEHVLEEMRERNEHAQSQILAQAQYNEDRRAHQERRFPYRLIPRPQEELNAMLHDDLLFQAQRQENREAQRIGRRPRQVRFCPSNEESFSERLSRRTREREGREAPTREQRRRQRERENAPVTYSDWINLTTSSDT